MDSSINRRRFMKTGMVLGASTAGFVSLEEKRLLAAVESGQDKPINKPASSSTLPTGKIGNLELSRMIAGGNIISGWCHQRDLLFVSPLAQAYLTPQKQHDTLQQLEESGVNAISIDMMQLDLINGYKKERGGQIKTVVGVRPDWGRWGNPKWEELKQAIDESLEQGADAPFLHGGFSDRLVSSGKKENLEMIQKALEYIHAQGVPAGLGSHALEVPVECAAAGITPDFYFKTFHHDHYWSAHPKENRVPYSVDRDQEEDHNQIHDNIFDLHSEKTIEFMNSHSIPWIAYKVLAAGAIKPESGFKFAFENGADFIAVGMFDFEIADDVAIAKKVLDTVGNRTRAWCA